MTDVEYRQLSCPVTRLPTYVLVENAVEEETEATHSGVCRVSDIREERKGSHKAAFVSGFGAVIVYVVGRAFCRMVKRNAVLKRELENAKTKYQGLITELCETQNALEDVNRELMQKDVEMSDLTCIVEEKAKALKEKEASLERLKGELGLSKSTISMVERELKATKQLLASYQGQADQAHVLRESNRENVATPGSLGIASLWI